MHARIANSASVEIHFSTQGPSMIAYMVLLRICPDANHGSELKRSLGAGNCSKPILVLKLFMHYLQWTKHTIRLTCAQVPS